MTAVSHDALDFSSWRFGHIVATGRNARCMSVNDGVAFPAAPPKVQLSTDDDPPLEVLEVKCDALTIRVPEDSSLLQSLSALDGFALDTAERHSTQCFQRDFQREQLAQLYRPLAADGRLSLGVAADVRVWRLLPTGDAERRVVEATPQDVVEGSKVWLCAEVRALCFLPRSFSFALAATDLLLLPAHRPRPFPFLSRKCSFAVEQQRTSDNEEGVAERADWQ
jgi:hypothetical protein